MPNATNHPSSEELQNFDQGKLPDDAAVSIADHLAECASCRDSVQNGFDDTFLRKLRGARPGASAMPVGEVLPPVSRVALVAAAPNDALTDLPTELAGYAKLKFVRELGRGGMGVVYQAIHATMSRPVAVKVINPKVLAHPDALPRFLSEVKAAAQLDHPNIVRAYDSEQVGDLHLLIMEFVPGRDLHDIIEKKGPLPVHLACHYVRQAALGLQHAHQKGTVHRDIKPRNLIVTREHLVKILDFGLARSQNDATDQSLTAVGRFMGTPHYVAPEQALDAHGVDTRADIYSLGATLFFLLTGHPPFQESTPMKTILARLERDAPTLIMERPELPSELCAIVARMLAKDPAQRYQQPVEVARALVPFIKSAVIPTPTNPAPPPDVKSKSSAVRPVLRGRDDAREKNPAPQPGPPDLRAKSAAAISDRQRAKHRRWVQALGAILGSMMLAGILIKITRPDGTEIKVPVAPGDKITIGADDAPQSTVPLRDDTRADFEKWMRHVSTLAAEEQVKAVTAKLQELNPGFDGKEQHAIVSDIVTSFTIATDAVADISPVKALSDLDQLRLRPNIHGKGKVVHLSPLEGLPLKELWIDGNQISDISPLSELKELITLSCSATQITNLAPLRSLKLSYLHCGVTRVSDLAPLAMLPLKSLNFHDTSVSDLSPLRACPLIDLTFYGTLVSDLEPLRQIPLTILDCSTTQISDLDPLRDMKLTFLALSNTQVSDLEPLGRMKLDQLVCYNTQVFDLSPLKDMNLSHLGIAGTQVTDLAPLAKMRLSTGAFDAGRHSLSPLRGMPFRELHIVNFDAKRDLPILQSMKLLKTVNFVPVAQFMDAETAKTNGSR